jgi:PAS domain S-box-containing protein
MVTREEPGRGQDLTLSEASSDMPRASADGDSFAASRSGGHAAAAQTSELLEDLQRTVDAMRMGVVVLDAQLNAEVINRAFYAIWKVTPQDVAVGSPFRALMDINRHNGVYDVPDSEWEDYVASRLAEIAAGSVAPREFRRADGCTMVYEVTELSGGKRLVTYFDISDLKQREAELAEALERTRLADAVIDGIRDPVFVKDSQLRFVYVNEAFANLFGVKPAQMIGRLGSHFVTPAEAAQFELSERQVLKTGEPYKVEEDFEFNGIGRSRIVRKNRIRTESGNDYVAGTIFDITEMKRRETDAEEARQRLENVLESLPAGVIIYDRHNRFVLANRLIQESLPALAGAMQPGKHLREALEAAHDAGYFRVSGDPEIDALYETDRAAWIDSYARRYDMRHSVSERRNPDGKWYQVFDTRTADGTFVGVRVDITELKEREDALREYMRQIDLFRHVLDELPVAAYVKDDDLSIRFVNKAWCTLTGVSKDEATGLTDREIFGETGADFARRDLEVLATGNVDETEETVPHRDGTSRQLIARKSRLTLSDGTVHLIGSSSDVTELKQRENELEEAQRRAVLADRAKSEFLANMSHEIRTPMNGVLGMAELLTKSNLDAKQKTFTDIIVKSGNALLTIINDILDFSKIDAGQLVLDPAPFNLAEAIEDVATLVSTRAKEKDLELIVRVQPGLPVLYVGDVGRIRQIITNLVGNAVKFTDSGHVLVDVSGVVAGSSAALKIAVTDTGIGIPAEKLQLVFEKFSQVDGSSTRRHEGTGLGLAITSRLVDMMNGRIDVESTENKGSTFTISLELPVAADQKTRRHAPLDVTGARILVIDDNPVNRAILMEQMNSWAFDACAADGGVEGLLVLEIASRLGLKVDCVILDYQMPGMTGADVARIIRANPALSDTPLILLTSVDQSLSNKSYRDLDIDAHLIKPARSSALLDALVTTIQRHRAPPVIAADPDTQSEKPSAPAPAAETSRSIASAARRGGGAPGIDILVAEDNEVNQLVFTQILSETDYTFEIVDNGRRAFEAYGSRHPKMILMDVSMPGMNGLEATAAIREREAVEGGHVPIVGVTAHALKGDRERCIDAGMDDYLSKPISPNALLAKVELWMEKAVARRNAG